MPVSGKFPPNAPTVSCLYLIVKNYLPAIWGCKGSWAHCYYRQNQDSLDQEEENGYRVEN